MKDYSKDLERILDDRELHDFNSQRVLITGGAGFLGSWLCEAFLCLGASVTCMDNFASGREENIRHLKKDPGFSFLYQDVSAPFNPDGGYDYILALASRASPLEFADHPIDILRSNTLGTMNALEIARKNGATLLFTSTSEVYGDASVFPTPESYNGNVNPVGIRGCYDEAKRAGEALCMAYYRQYGTDARIVRIFNTYGPRMRSDGIYGRVIPRFITQAMQGEPFSIFGDGLQTRSFCYVTDQVRGLIRFISRPGLAGNIINIGNPEEVSILDLARCIAEIHGSEPRFEYHPQPPDDPRRRLPDITKARKVLGWTPEVPLKEGLEKMIHWCRDRPS